MERMAGTTAPTYIVSKARAIHQLYFARYFSARFAENYYLLSFSHSLLNLRLLT